MKQKQNEEKQSKNLILKLFLKLALFCRGKQTNIDLFFGQTTSETRTGLQVLSLKNVYRQILLLILIMPHLASAINLDSFSYSVHVGSSHWFTVKHHTLLVHEYNYVEPHKPSWTAIPSDEITTKALPPLINEGSYYLQIGLANKLRPNLGWQCRVGYERSSFKSFSDRSLRFSDQIDKNQGFVKPSIYDPIEPIHVSNQLFTIDAYGQLVLGKPEAHIIGLGLQSYIGLKSTYSFSATRWRSVETYYYAAQDRMNGELLWNIMPSLNYQARLLKHNSNTIWLEITLAYTFTPDHRMARISDSSTEVRRFPWVHLGLLYCFNP